jgi:hypothetical protein
MGTVPVILPETSHVAAVFAALGKDLTAAEVARLA